MIKPTLLITGGSGFLGMHLADKLSGNYHIIIADINTFDSREYSKDIVFSKTDVRNKKALEPLVKKAKFIIHTAAALPLWKRSDIFTTNVDGTRNMVELTKKHKIKRLVHISSTAVYGVPEKHPIEEDDPLVGVGPYGESKIQAEEACFKAIDNEQPITILRPKTFVGTGRLGVFEILFDWIHDGKRIPIIGSGNNRYQLLDVDDLVLACNLSLKAGKEANSAFNVGAMNFETVKADLEKLFKTCSSKSRIFPTPAMPIKTALFIFEKLGISPLYQWVYDTADKDSFVSTKKLQEKLGWKAKYSNAEALIKAYQWYQKHYKEIKSQHSGVTHRTGWDQGILKFFKKFL